MALNIELGKFRFAIGRKRPPLKELGATGTKFWSGFISDEYLTELGSVTKKVDVYEKMRSGDGMVKAVLLALELSIKSGEWFIEGGEDVNEEARQHIEEALFERMSLSWDEFLHHVLTFLPFGWSMFEKVFKIEDGKVWWKKLAPRLQKSLYKWKLDDEGGLKGITQWVLKKGVYQYIDIDVPQLLVFTFMREGSNYEGTSILRSAYKHWYINDILYKISGIGLERQAVGLPVGKLAENYSDPDKTALESLVQNLRTNEEAGAVLPPGFDLQILEGKIHAEALLKHIEHHNRMIAKCALAMFLSVGEGRTGSFALSKDQSDFFMMSLNAVCNNICNIINRYAIPQLVGYNYPTQKYPKLNYTLGKLDAVKVIEGIEKMVEKKVIITDDDDEKYLRSLLGLPELKDEVITERETQDEEDEAKEDQIRKENLQAKTGIVPEGFEFMSYPTYRKPKKRVKRTGRRRGVNENIKLADKLYWRKLTKWEQGVKFKELNDRFTKSEQALIAELFGVSELQMDDLIKQVEKILTTGKLNDLYKITVRNRGTYAETLRNFMKELADYGKGLAQGETGVKVGEVSSALKNWLNVKGNTIVELHAAKMKSNAMLHTLAGVNAGKAPKGILYDVKVGMRDYIERELNGTANIVVAESINQGRNEIIRSGEMQAAQYSAILDRTTCPLCSQMDGQIVDVDSPDFDRFTPPTHSNCRCVWVYIKKEEEDVEIDWSAPAEGTVDRYGQLVP